MLSVACRHCTAIRILACASSVCRARSVRRPIPRATRPRTAACRASRRAIARREKRVKSRRASAKRRALRIPTAAAPPRLATYGAEPAKNVTMTSTPTTASRPISSARLKSSSVCSAWATRSAAARLPIAIFPPGAAWSASIRGTALRLDRFASRPRTFVRKAASELACPVCGRGTSRT